MNSFFIRMMTYNSKYPKKVSEDKPKITKNKEKMTDQEYKKHMEKQRAISCFMGGAFNVNNTNNF